MTMASASLSTLAYIQPDLSISKTSMTYSGFESRFSQVARTSAASLSTVTRRFRTASLTNAQTV